MKQCVNTILDELVASYEGPEEINSLETHALPNRRAVIEAFTHIQHLLFLGYFSTRELNESVLRLALAEHLLPAKELLCEQVKRAAMWEERGVPSEEKQQEGWCALAVMSLLSDLPKLRQKLYGDIRAAYANDPAAESIEDVVFSYPGVFAITAYRVAHHMFKSGVPMIPRILSEFAHERTGIDIHPGAEIGERFFMDHGTGIVIGATTIIGNDVKLYQGVTLGALSINGDVPRHRDEVEKRHPTLMDGVTVYTGSTILGGDTIVGKNSVIGGNIWLAKSVPDDSRLFFRPTNGDNK